MECWMRGCPGRRCPQYWLVTWFTLAGLGRNVTVFFLNVWFNNAGRSQGLQSRRVLLHRQQLKEARLREFGKAASERALNVLNFDTQPLSGRGERLQSPLTDMWGAVLETQCLLSLDSNKVKATKSTQTHPVPQTDSSETNARAGTQMEKDGLRACASQ